VERRGQNGECPHRFYDDAVNVILLSQRFSPQNNDIRFSIAADKNIDDALTGVTPDSLANAIEDIIVNAKIDIRGTDGEKLAAKIAATEFFRKYSRMKIPLSTGAFMFFAPDARAVIRYNGDRNLAWAEYAMHQVTNNHEDGNGKMYRSYNKGKVEVVNPLLDKIVQEDNAEISARGNVLFYSQIDAARYAKVIASPTEEGNYRADLTDVSSVLEQGKMPAKLNPLGAAIGTDGLGGVFTSAPTPLVTPHNISAICFCRQRGYSILPPLSDARRLCGY
jgi:hypothetical protein